MTDTELVRRAVRLAVRHRLKPVASVRDIFGVSLATAEELVAAHADDIIDNRDRPVTHLHASVVGGNLGGAACAGYGGRVLTTTDLARVTCRRCRNIVAASAAIARAVGGDES